MAKAKKSQTTESKKVRTVNQSEKRKAAEAALKAAASDQEKTVARSMVKHARFEDLGNQRISRLLKTFDSILKLTNRAAYSWTADQAAKIEEAINGRVTLLLTSLNQKGKEVTKETFKM